MSDGPHRSLPLRPHWKTFARRAANAAHSAGEVHESLTYALKRDILQAPIKPIRDIMFGDSLFPTMRTKRLEALRAPNAGSASANCLVDCAIATVSNGMAGEVGAEMALQMALEDTMRSHARSIEEHYQREASPRSREFVRQRLDAATQSFDCGALAREILAFEKPTQRSAKLTVQSGLDQGPAL